MPTTQMRTKTVLTTTLALVLLAGGVGIVYGAEGQGVPEETPATNPAEIRRGIRMGGNPEERQRQATEAMVRRLEPGGKGVAERVPTYIEFFKRDVVKDVRMFAFDARAEVGADGAIVLKGYAEYPEHRAGVERMLGALGFGNVRNEMELLPSAELGERRFAVVTAKHGYLYDKTTKPRETMNEALTGECVWLLKAVDGHYLCHSAEGYTGYIEAGDVKLVGRSEFFENMAKPRGKAFRDGKETVEAVIASASKWLGTKYVWGAKTDEGVDCSGLVQTAFASQGVFLPRDADQQGMVGLLVATRDCRDGLRRGDTLYFMSRRGTISHTAIYLGNNEYIEASGKVKITSLDANAPNYDGRRNDTFCFARRVIE